MPLFRLLLWANGRRSHSQYFSGMVQDQTRLAAGPSHASAPASFPLQDYCFYHLWGLSSIQHAFE